MIVDTSNPAYKHGHAPKKPAKCSPTYISWLSMRTRVRNKNIVRAARYTGRNIDMDPRWDDFAMFLQDMGVRPKGKSLDRIDNDRGYWPDNCKWSTPLEQNRNSTNCRYMTHAGRTMRLKEWAKHLGITRSSLHKRIKLWGEERALSTGHPGNRRIAGN